VIKTYISATCKAHTIISIKEYQSELEEIINNYISKTKSEIEEFKLIIDNLTKESQSLNQKKEKNSINLKIIEEFCQKMEDIISMKQNNINNLTNSMFRMSNSQISCVNYEKIEEMIKIEKEFEEKLKLSFDLIEKNEKDEKLMKIEENLENEKKRLKEEFEEKEKKLKESFEKKEDEFENYKNKENEKLGNEKKELIKKEEDMNVKNCEFIKKIEELTKEIEELRKEIDNEKPLIELGKQKQKEIEEEKKRKMEELIMVKNEKCFKDSFLTIKYFKILENYIIDALKENDNSKMNEWKKRYRATRDGFCGSDFHSKCDNLNHPTIVIIKTTDGSIFGGFTTKNWDSENHYVTDSEAFIFSLFHSMNSNR